MRSVRSARQLTPIGALSMKNTKRTYNSVKEKERNSKRKEWMRLYRSKPEVKEKARLYHKRPEVKLRDQSQRLVRKYGINLQNYNELMKVQNECCKICKINLSSALPVVDHNHVTKEVRGILCHKCNVVLGLTKEDPKILAALIQYISTNGVINE
jgi:hypothetical protein